jgi:transcription initiation factor TFIIIB Brf1 subunit/transcription initiation factor TFIIB
MAQKQLTRIEKLEVAKALSKQHEKASDTLKKMTAAMHAIPKSVRERHRSIIRKQPD